jgi:hypothetical protein
MKNKNMNMKNKKDEDEDDDEDEDVDEDGDVDEDEGEEINKSHHTINRRAKTSSKASSILSFIYYQNNSHVQ